MLKLFLLSLTSFVFARDIDIQKQVTDILAGPQPECISCLESAYRAVNPLCENGLDDSWKANCDKLFDAGIPKDALEFTLKTFNKNLHKFKSNKCFKWGEPKNHYSFARTNEAEFKNKVKDGIANKCQIVINDTREKQMQYRGTMYYIDLCEGSEPKVIKTYFNMGTGTYTNNFANVSGKKSTVLGAFLTNYQVFDYQPGNVKYQNLRSFIKTKIGKNYAHGVQLFGLQKTNNNASNDMKYLHVSPYRSSWGCPSIDQKNYWMIEELAKNGPSLLVNYGEKSKMEDINKCSED
ncbi:hypothetical protein [Bacteriovorax sp. Seq25_V]|uniref:hypothetical protein n=1 Tax=Bacteriovorax sp. Seq25_V TaxID=1201288 RepID=UPI000389DCB5|nr:hypothetical protein [Bacteriovorax sp. Seq25_V]EQC44744.1 hypothetical protein M900_0384 [Bacteriovorax sp. Seq25_V]